MKNIYYLFGVNYQIFKDISVKLHQDDNNFSFYGLAYAKTPYLDDKIFSHVTYISDLLKKPLVLDYSFLRELEVKYDLTISDLIHSDRHIMRFSSEHRLIIAQTLLQTFLMEIKYYKIDIVFSASVADFISLFASIYCKRNNIKFRYFIGSGLSEFFFFSDDLAMEPINFRKHYNDTLKEAADSVYKNKIHKKRVEFFRKKPQAGYVTKAGFLYKIFEWQDILLTLRHFKSYFKDSSGFHYNVKPWMLPFQRLRKVTRKLQYSKHIHAKEITFSDIQKLDYLIFPLQVYPEASTIVQGRRFHDQLGIIEMLSKALPVNVTLIVKEHRVCIGRRPIQFYKSIANLHNVKLVNEMMDSYDLIQYSKGVATISSTLGLEALLLNKPVLVFGEKYYNSWPGAFIAANFREIKSQVEKLLSYQCDAESADILFESITRSSHNIDFFLPNKYSSEQLKKLADIILTCINN